MTNACYGMCREVKKNPPKAYIYYNERALLEKTKQVGQKKLVRQKCMQSNFAVYK